MPKLTTKPPKYRRHSTRNVAFMVLNGKRIYLPGKYGSAESKAEYRRRLLEWTTVQENNQGPSYGMAINELILQYFRFAKSYYVKHGEQTDEVACIRQALKPLRRLYGTTPAAEFGPKKLANVRAALVQQGLARTTINKAVCRIRRMFRWASENELLVAEYGKPAPWLSLKDLSGLQRGRTDAREPDPVKPVADAVVEATLPHLPTVVSDMVRFQRLSGCRPQDVCNLQSRDIDRTGDDWVYVVRTHKTLHHGLQRLVVIGPRAQEILTPYLSRPADAYCFSPKESEQKRRETRRGARVTPIGYGNAPGTNQKNKTKRCPSDKYTTASYRRAIHRAAEKAGVPQWSPNQLRHATGTEVRKRYGLEGAQVILGHASADVTQIYAERNLQKAIEIMREIG